MAYRQKACKQIVHSIIDVEKIAQVVLGHTPEFFLKIVANDNSSAEKKGLIAK